MNYMRSFTNLKEQSCTKSQLVRKIQTQANTNASRFLSSRSAWDRANLGPGIVRLVISEQDPTQIVYCLSLQRKADL